MSTFVWSSVAGLGKSVQKRPAYREPLPRASSVAADEERSGLRRRGVGRVRRHDGDRLGGVVGIEDHPHPGVGVGGLAGHRGDDGHLVDGGSEDVLQAPGDSGADAADR